MTIKTAASFIILLLAAVAGCSGGGEKGDALDTPDAPDTPAEGDGPFDQDLPPDADAPGEPDVAVDDAPGDPTIEPLPDVDPDAPPVSAPAFVMNLSIGNTGWFSSPAVLDLDGDGAREIVAPFYDIAVWDAAGNLLHRRDQGTYHEGRVYAPAVVADIDQDSVTEVVVAAGSGTVAAYGWTGGQLAIEPGWEAATTCVADSCFENRSIGADDLDGNGTIETVVSSTRSEQPPGYDGTNPHVFVFEAGGALRSGWPRYDTRTGTGRDLPGGPDGYCYGHSGFGSYGLNVGLGNVDDDADVEIIVTYDNHHIQVFNPDGLAMLADPAYFTRRDSDCNGEPMSWGQFIRYLDPVVEENHYHLHTGEWPGPSWTMWLQWTQSPPGVADINGDGLNEVIGVPNAEQDEPYHTYHHAVMVLEGDYEAGGHRAARRLPGWETLPLTGEPFVNDDWYPPSVVPAPAIANIQGDGRPEIIVPSPDGRVYAFGPDAATLWSYDYSRGEALMYASETAVADLNRDGSPEIIFGTYGEPGGEYGHLVILSAAGALLFDVPLPGQNPDSGNGVGPCAAPTVADLDGDGDLEILLLTIDHGLDVFTVDGSACAPPAGADPGLYCGPWPTGRGNYLRNGRPPGT